MVLRTTLDRNFTNAEDQMLDVLKVMRHESFKIFLQINYNHSRKSIKGGLNEHLTLQQLHA